MAKINWKSADFMFEEKRKAKIADLNQKCNDTITGRFSLVIANKTYYFSNDEEAQKNFDKGLTAFDKGFLTELPWTAYDASGNVVRLTVTKDLMTPLYMAHLMHIQENISKFRDTLLPKVNAAKTDSDLALIQW